jgi:hypothetical protein
MTMHCEETFNQSSMCWNEHAQLSTRYMEAMCLFHSGMAGPDSYIQLEYDVQALSQFMDIEPTVYLTEEWEITEELLTEIGDFHSFPMHQTWMEDKENEKPVESFELVVCMRSAIRSALTELNTVQQHQNHWRHVTTTTTTTTKTSQDTLDTWTCDWTPSALTPFLTDILSQRVEFVVASRWNADQIRVFVTQCLAIWTPRLQRIHDTYVKDFNPPLIFQWMCQGPIGDSVDPDLPDWHHLFSVRDLVQSRSSSRSSSSTSTGLYHTLDAKHMEALTKRILLLGTEDLYNAHTGEYGKCRVSYGYPFMFLVIKMPKNQLHTANPSILDKKSGTYGKEATNKIAYMEFDGLNGYGTPNIGEERQVQSGRPQLLYQCQRCFTTCSENFNLETPSPFCISCNNVAKAATKLIAALPEESTCALAGSPSTEFQSLLKDLHLQMDDVSRGDVKSQTFQQFVTTTHLTKHAAILYGLDMSFDHVISQSESDAVLVPKW